MRGMTRCADWKGVNIMTKQDPHSRITDRILAELEQGTRPWLKPWSGGEMAATGQTRPLRATGQPYRGINVLLLWIEAQAPGFVSLSWMIYRQAQALGAQVRKSEHCATVVYYGDSSKTVRDEDSGEDREQAFRFLKTYTVFNVRGDHFLCPPTQSRGQAAPFRRGLVAITLANGQRLLEDSQVYAHRYRSSSCREAARA